MSGIEQNWIEVHDMYFGNAVWPSSVRYRVADDGEVQRQVDVALIFREETLNETTQALSVESSNVDDAITEGLHDIRTYLHVVGGSVKNLWIQGWEELGESGSEILEHDRAIAMGGGRIIPWPEYIVEGE